MKSIHIGALQLPTLGMNATRLEFYVKNAKKHGAKVLLLGEYVLNHFFKELNNMPRSMVKEQSKNHIQKLKKLSKEFDIIFVAPYVEVKKNRFFKKIIKISPKSI
ncbi:MAG: carbon-nitrogen hydrolase family protein, partial [Epsilonproteobacteria bacterium]|nr:carbon-nitrogen hydrolase family protein [Campylobacterota bacterium]